MKRITKNLFKSSGNSTLVRKSKKSGRKKSSCDSCETELRKIDQMFAELGIFSTKESLKRNAKEIDAYLNQLGVLRPSGSPKIL